MWNRQVGAFSRKGDLYQRISVIGGGQFQVGKHCIPGSKKGHGAGKKEHGTRKKDMALGKGAWRRAMLKGARGNLVFQKGISYGL